MDNAPVMPPSRAQAFAGILLSAVATLGSAPVFAARQRLECPPQIPETAIQVNAKFQGWRSFTAAPLYLNTAGPAGGPPEKTAQLVETSSTYKPGTTAWVDTYTLAGAFPEGKWFECRYGTLNQVVLARPIEASTSRCRLSYRKGAKAGQNDITVLCE